jgi:DNA-binding CsgD family transcriptional regulator
MTLEQAVDAVLNGPHPARAATGWLSLTERELEIASLVADGLSNPEIASRVFIGRETVKTHLANIFTKLGVNRRSMLALEVAAHRDPPETAGPGPNGALGG